MPTFSMFFYPREGSSFTDDDAWSLIDRVVDPKRRGALLPHELASDDAPAPFRLGRNCSSDSTGRALSCKCHRRG